MFLYTSTYLSPIHIHLNFTYTNFIWLLSFEPIRQYINLFTDFVLKMLFLADFFVSVILVHIPIIVFRVYYSKVSNQPLFLPSNGDFFLRKSAQIRLLALSQFYYIKIIKKGTILLIFSFNYYRGKMIFFFSSFVLSIND